jgi:hypothetical protein
MSRKKKYKRLIKKVEKAHKEAVKVSRHGHVGVRANALRHLSSAADDLKWLRAHVKECG